MKQFLKYAKRLFLIVKTNIFYIIWFFIYFNYSLTFSFPFFRENTLLFCAIIYAISLTVALGAGDIIFRLLEGARPLETKREKEYLTPIFEEVYQNAKEIYSDLPKIKLYIVDSLTVNAVAIGNHTIAVTQGAMETLTADELSGVIAHEISHVYYGDTKAVIVNTIGNGIFTILSVIVKLIVRGMEFIAMTLESHILQAVFNFIRLILEIWLFCMLWLGSFILSFNSRGNEFKADKFAYEVGYGEQLTQALYIIQKMSLGQQMKIVAKMQSSHPRTSKRIGRLEDLTDRDFE